MGKQSELGLRDLPGSSPGLSHSDSGSEDSHEDPIYRLEAGSREADDSASITQPGGVRTFEPMSLTPGPGLPPQMSVPRKWFQRSPLALPQNLLDDYL